MNSFSYLDLDNLDRSAAKTLHRIAFGSIADNTKLINGKYFFAKRAEIKKYIKEIPDKVTHATDKVPSDNDFVNYMLNFFLIPDDSDSPKKLGLLTTLVNGAGTHFLYSTKPGEDKYLLFQAKSNIKFPNTSAQFYEMKAMVQHVNKIDELDDRLDIPEKFHKKAPDSSVKDFQGWLEQHNVGDCLSNYKSYIQGSVKRKHVNRALNYVSIWEMEELLSDTFEGEWIGIFPIVMKSTSATRSPKSAHFMSLLFVPLDGEAEGENFTIKNINSTKPFVLSSKGYPRKWADNKELALKGDCSKKIFNLSEF